jgi:hypothetical protein
LPSNTSCHIFSYKYEYFFPRVAYVFAKIFLTIEQEDKIVLSAKVNNVVVSEIVVAQLV